MAKKEVKLISITLEQHERLKEIADKERRTMRAVLDIMMDVYEGGYKFKEDKDNE